MSRLVILVTREDAETLYHALAISSGALSMGWEVHVFLTSSASVLLTKEVKGRAKLGIKGLSKWFVKNRMKKLNIAEVDEVLMKVLKAGAKFYADEAALRIAGYSPEDLMEGVKVANTVSFLNLAKEADVVLSL
ncbi:MAG: DsrE/DsrF/DrsH-like family protein [Thermoprotei archaeon]|jgi:predicted peroxiredoxin